MSAFSKRTQKIVADAISEAKKRRFNDDEGN